MSRPALLMSATIIRMREFLHRMSPVPLPPFCSFKFCVPCGDGNPVEAHPNRRLGAAAPTHLVREGSRGASHYQAFLPSRDLAGWLRSRGEAEWPSRSDNSEHTATLCTRRIREIKSDCSRLPPEMSPRYRPHVEHGGASEMEPGSPVGARLDNGLSWLKWLSPVCFVERLKRAHPNM